MATTEKLEVKILVLDDERLIRRMRCARLKQAGYEAVAVATVDEGQLCNGIRRQRFGALNESIFNIPLDAQMEDDQ